jgi:hypothetical protein
MDYGCDGKTLRCGAGDINQQKFPTTTGLIQDTGAARTGALYRYINNTGAMHCSAV